MKFGVFDHVDDNGLPHAQQLRDRLDLVEAIERAGFFCYHLAEHHGTPLSKASPPGAMLGAISQRTTTLRFGPLVYLLPLHDPLALIEEVCVLDQLSNGRFQLGIGRGGVPEEHALFGLDEATLAARFAETKEILLRGLTSEVLDFAGTFHSYRNVPLQYRPVQRPYPPIWYGTATPESALWTAACKANVLTLGPAARARAVGDRYREEWTKLGNDPADLPMLGMTRRIVVADSDDVALRIARPAYLRANASLNWLWQRAGKELHLNAIFGATFDDAMQHGVAFAGSPASVRAYLHAQQAESGVNYLATHLVFGTMDKADAMRSIELFGREVMPAFADRAASGATR